MTALPKKRKSPRRNHVRKREICYHTCRLTAADYGCGSGGCASCSGCATCVHVDMMTAGRNQSREKARGLRSRSLPKLLSQRPALKGTTHILPTKGSEVIVPHILHVLRGVAHPRRGRSSSSRRRARTPSRTDQRGRGGARDKPISLLAQEESQSRRGGRGDSTEGEHDDWV